MRIIAGTKKKLKLYEPMTDKIRPTTDRAKESLFNLIGPKIIDSIFIDLFTGSGAIALEAKSRNAKTVYAVDHLFDSKRLVMQNMERSNLKIEFSQMKVLEFLQTFVGVADLIFMDAPYEMSNEQMFTIIDLILSQKKVKNDGLIIIERKTSKENEIFLERYNFGEIRSYGKVSFIILGER